METRACLNLPPGDPSAPFTARSSAVALYHENTYRSRSLLRNLRQYAKSLRHFEGKKNLTLFSDGFLSEDVIYDLQDVVDQALRAGVVFNTVDARGL